MNVFHRVTLASLKKNPTRTVVTVIGIMLSAAMICAVTTSVSSFQNYALENTVYREGSWHGAALSAEEEMLKTVVGSDLVERTVYSQQIGYATAEGCINDYKPYLFVIGTGEGFDEVMPVHISAGQYPKTPNEILLPEHLRDNGGISHKIGDVITLALGDRIGAGEARLDQRNPLQYVTEPMDESGDLPLDGSETTSSAADITVTEDLTVRESRTYMVVGFYERPQFENYSAPGYTAITVADRQPKDGVRYDIYFSMNDPDDVYGFMDENGISGIRNSDVLILMGTSQYDSFDRMLGSLAAIVIGLILFGSVSLIYNAFSISVSERTKQFGLLSSVGATKKQLRKMVFYEAMVVSAIGIPLGILAGIGGIGITLMIIGHRFSALYGYNIPMRVNVSLTSVLIAIGVALITVLISAWIPSKRAMKVSAVEAIRQNCDIKTKNKDVKTPKIVYKLFGLPGMLANKHYKRNRKKYRTTVVSLFMSIVLFVSASAFSDYLTESAEAGFEALQYDLRYYSNADNFSETDPEALLEKIAHAEGVTSAMVSTRDSHRGRGPMEQYSETIRQGAAHGDGTLPEEWEDTFYECYIPDGEFRRILKSNGLKDTDYFNRSDPMALAFDGEQVFDREQGKYVTVNTFSGNGVSFVTETAKVIEGYEYMGDGVDKKGNPQYHYVNEQDGSAIVLSAEEAIVKTTLRAEKTVYERPYYLPEENPLMVYPLSMMDAVREEPYANRFYNFYIQTSDHEIAFENVKETLVSNGFSSNNLYDYAASGEEERNIITIITVFAYGFIVLISLIAAANVFNTISTNIALRRREFAMLKSVGMTANGFHRMMNFECILYGTRSLLWGLPVSAGVTFLIHLAVNQGFETPFRLPWSAIGIAVLSVFAVVFITMLYAMSKIRKDNPIDALKNENL